MIGIIGGAGVAATNKLCELIETDMTKGGAFRDAHHPEMIIYQATKVPSRSMYYEERGESFIPEYIRIGKILKDCGANRLVMCCNTAHIAINEIRDAVGLPFIDVIEETAKVIHHIGVKRVGILCSESISKYRFYDKYIKKDHPEVETIYPDTKNQGIVTRGICNAKNKVRFESKGSKDHPYCLFSNVVNNLIDNKVDCIVAGCTDIRNVFYPNIIELQKQGVYYVDCLEVLAQSIIENSEL